MKTENKLFLLTKIEDPKLEQGEEYPWYDMDCVVGQVVCAKDEGSAREIASKNALDEGARTWLKKNLVGVECIADNTTKDEGLVLLDAK